MRKEAIYRPKGSNVTILSGKNGGKKFTVSTPTKSGMKQVSYNYAPKHPKK
jgi:hypothetical protein